LRCEKATSTGDRTDGKAARDESAPQNRKHHVSLKGGGLDVDLDGLPSDWDLEEPDAKEAELVKATRERRAGQMVMRTYAENLCKAF
jgi:hypothetical protein